MKQEQRENLVNAGMRDVVNGIAETTQKGVIVALPSFLVGAGVGILGSVLITGERETIGKTALAITKVGIIASKHSLPLDTQVSIKSQLLAVVADVIVLGTKHFENKPASRIAAWLVTNPKTIDGVGKIYQGASKIVFG